MTISIPPVCPEQGRAYNTNSLEKGIEIAGRMIRQLKDENVCDGVHIMAIGKEAVIPDILSVAGLNGA